MKILYSIFILLFFSSGALSDALITDKYGQQVPSSFDVQLIKAKEYRLPHSSKYDPEKSVKTLKMLVSKKPDYYRGYYNLGLAYSELNQYQKSKKQLRKSIKNPQR